MYDGLLGGFVGLLGGGANLVQNKLAQRPSEQKARDLVHGRAELLQQALAAQAAYNSTSNVADVRTLFAQATEGTKAGITLAFNSLRQTGGVDTSESAVTAAVREATENGKTAPTVQQTEAQPTAQEIAQAEATIQASEKAIAQAEAANTARSQLNIDNTAIRNYTENINDDVQGGLLNDGNRVDRGLVNDVSERLDIGGERTENGRVGRGNQVLSRRNLTQSVKDALKDSGVVAAELVDYSADGAAFSDALASAREADVRNGWAVTPQSADKLQGKQLFADANGTIGFAITPDGDIEAVFKNRALNKTAHAMDGVMPQAIAAGGVKLDCYGEKLVNTYERYGFTPVARVEFNPKHAISFRVIVFLLSCIEQIQSHNGAVDLIEEFFLKLRRQLRDFLAHCFFFLAHAFTSLIHR